MLLYFKYQHGSTDLHQPKLLIRTVRLFVWSWSNFHIILFRVPIYTVWSFKDGCADLLEMQVDKKCPSKYSLFACFSDVLVTWLCDIIAVSHILDMNVINSYFQSLLHRYNTWVAGQHKTMANFMSVAYVRNRCWYNYNVPQEHLRLDAPFDTNVIRQESNTEPLIWKTHALPIAPRPLPWYS